MTPIMTFFLIINLYNYDSNVTASQISFLHLPQNAGEKSRVCWNLFISRDKCYNWKQWGYFPILSFFDFEVNMITN